MPRKKVAKKPAKIQLGPSVSLLDSIEIVEPEEFGNEQEDGKRWVISVRYWGNRDHRDAQAANLGRGKVDVQAALIQAATDPALRDNPSEEAIQRKMAEIMVANGSAATVMGDMGDAAPPNVAAHVVCGLENVADTEGKPILYSPENALAILQLAEPIPYAYEEAVEIPDEDEPEPLKIPKGTPLGDAWFALIQVRSRALHRFRENAAGN